MRLPFGLDLHQLIIIGLMLACLLLSSKISSHLHI